MSDVTELPAAARTLSIAPRCLAIVGSAGARRPPVRRALLAPPRRASASISPGASNRSPESDRGGEVPRRFRAWELLAAVAPGGDIYQDHRDAWGLVASAGRGIPGPSGSTIRSSLIDAVGQGAAFVFRREAQDALLRLRLRAGAAPVGARAVQIDLAEGLACRLDSKLVPWRSVDEARRNQGISGQSGMRHRVRDLICEAGFELESLWLGDTEVAEGFKLRGGHRISLPVVAVRASVHVRDVGLAGRAWLEGIGRARRFGFGMVDLLSASPV